MIISIKFSNFYSFADETQLSFGLGKQPSPSYYDIDGLHGYRLNKVVAVVGANGSGKTQLIKPLAFVAWFITDSFLGADPEADIPIQPHALRQDSDSKFEIDFLLRTDEYRYKLVVNNKHVVHESLYRKTSHLFSYIFVRELDASSDKSLYSYKQKSFGFPESKAKQIRGNASLISAAHSYDVELATSFVKYFSKCSYNISVSGRNYFHSGVVMESAEFFYNNKHMRSRMEEMICDFDLGLCSVEIDKTETKDQQGDTKAYFMPIGIHTCESGGFKLPFMEESSGTQSAFALLRTILPVLEFGGFAIIDEIDNDLHPHMLPRILELFKFKDTNPHQAQIIFTCHTPEVLNLLMKHQVYLVEKQNQKSEAWRLDKVTGLRADDNLYAKYMAGALSAVPDL